jgi:hypothetical protein
MLLILNLYVHVVWASKILPWIWIQSCFFVLNIKHVDMHTLSRCTTPFSATVLESRPSESWFDPHLHPASSQCTLQAFFEIKAAWTRNYYHWKNKSAEAIMYLYSQTLIYAKHPGETSFNGELLPRPIQSIISSRMGAEASEWSDPVGFLSSSGPLYTLGSAHGHIFLDRVATLRLLMSPDFFVVHMAQYTILLSGLICCAQDGRIVLTQKTAEAQQFCWVKALWRTIRDSGSSR